MSHHILMCADYFLPHRGGIEVCVSHHITGALQAGYRVSILTSRHDPSLPSQETIQTPDGEYIIYRVGSSRWSYLRKSVSFCRRFLYDEQVDLIHCHTYAAALVGAWIRRTYHITTLVTVHEVFGRLWHTLKPRRSAWIYRMIERRIVTRSYDHIHTPSDYTRTMLSDDFDINKQSITTIYHGVDASRSADSIDPALVQQRRDTLGSDRRIILYYGHAGASKGIRTLVSAMQRFLPDHPDALRVANITASREREHIIHTIQHTLPANSYHIETSTPLTDLQALVMAADLVVVPSLSEGFGFVGAEVSALGKTAIISRGGPLPEIVSGPIAFFDPGNVDQLTQLLHNTQTTNIPRKSRDRTQSLQSIQKLRQTLLQ